MFFICFLCTKYILKRKECVVFVEVFYIMFNIEIYKYFN